MSRADQLFIENCKEILAHGVWDTDQSVRPRWDDGSPAHTVKRFGIVNRYDLREEFPAIAACVEEIAEHIEKTWYCTLSEEEKLYLILHVNRILAKEGL